MASLRAEDIDWTNQTISYARMKTGSQAMIRFGDIVVEVLRRRPEAGYLFPQIVRWKESDRAKAFIRRCRLVQVSGVSLHSYRYAWAERARTCGFPERFAQEALVEGFFGAIKLHQNGWRKVVAIMGSTMSAAQEALIRQHTSADSRIVVMLDEDNAGQAGRENIAARLSKFCFVNVHEFEKLGTQPEHLSAEELQQILGGVI
jgi:5S rRNA maturation endonuclease (ribonuclease M5)